MSCAQPPVRTPARPGPLWAYERTDTRCTGDLRQGERAPAPDPSPSRRAHRGGPAGTDHSGTGVRAALRGIRCPSGGAGGRPCAPGGCDRRRRHRAAAQADAAGPRVLARRPGPVGLATRSAGSRPDPDRDRQTSDTDRLGADESLDALRGLQHPLHVNDDDQDTARSCRRCR